MLPPPVTADKAARKGASAALPLAAICCLCVLFFLLAATIILALIPVYLPKKDLSNLPSTKTKYIILNPQQYVPAYGTASSSACNAIASKMASAIGYPSGSITSSSCSFAVGSRRRRRSKWLSRSRRQSRSGKLFMQAVINYDKCQRCRLSSYLKKLLGITFTADFIYYGSRSVTFTVASISDTPFGSLSTDATTTTTTTTTTSTTTT
ncbi:unnamed protein product [Rotaria sp. Silwood1]|nr:unnamed protein product [Rotaria sp. Silwood1]